MTKASTARALMAVLLVACSGTPAPSSAPPPAVALSASPTAHGAVPVAPAPSSAPPTAPALRGTVLSLQAEREAFVFFADGPRLFALGSREGVSPREYRVSVADASAGSWRPIHTTDAFMTVSSVAHGRAALIVTRDQAQGYGATTQDYVVLDLSTGRATTIASHALGPATVRGGGGGGPRQPGAGIVLGADHAAYTRLVEGPGGSVTGELHVVPMADPSASRRIGSSTVSIAPLGISGRRLTYVLGGATEDELRVRDLVSGAERIVARAPVGRPGVEHPPLLGAAVAGDRAVWLESDIASGAAGPAHIIDLVNGVEIVRTYPGGSCGRPSATARHLAWSCRSGPGRAAATATVLDATTLATLDLLAGVAANELTASGEGLVWTNPAGDGRRVTYFVPSTP